MSETYVPEGATPLSLDEPLKMIVETQKAKSILDKKIKNLKEVAKAHLAEKNLEEYATIEGHKCKFYYSQKAKYDKELIKEATGELFELCVSFSTVTNFKVS